MVKLSASSDTISKQDQYRLAHAEKYFNLIHENWILVSYKRGGGVSSISLGSLLEDSHKIEDLAMGDPVERAAMRRFLTAITIDLIQTQSPTIAKDYWKNRFKNNEGFPSEMIEGYLKLREDDFFLYHPSKPFMQSVAYISENWKDPWATSYRELLSYQPGETARSWNFKPNDPTFNSGLPLQKVAISLIARWFYAFTGNGGGGDKGGLYLSAGTGRDAPATNYFRIHPEELFRTMLKNISINTIDLDPEALVKGLAWLDNERPRLGGNGLYNYTLTLNFTLLGSVKDGKVYEILRGTPNENILSKEQTERIKDSIKGKKEKGLETKDPHRIQFAQDNGKISSDIRIDPTVPSFQQLQRLRSGILSNLAGKVLGIASEGNVWIGKILEREEYAELFTGILGGTSMSAQWEVTRTILIDTNLLDPEWENSGSVSDLIQVAFGEAGIEKGIKRAIREAIPDPEISNSIKDSAVNRWLNKTDTLVRQAIYGEISSSEAEKILWKEGFRALELSLRPYSITPRYSGSVAEALSKFRWQIPKIEKSEL